MSETTSAANLPVDSQPWRVRSTLHSRLLKALLLAWMLGLVFLDWFMYQGPGMVITARLFGVLPLMMKLGEPLRHLFTRPYIF
jgi:hypothetical protein